MGIENRFQHILISEECGFAKPAYQIFQCACRMAAAPPNEVVHVGDHLEIDVNGSLKAGLRGIWLNRQGPVHDGGHNEAIHSLMQLAEILRLGNSG
jgi:putative hydrolase of the HAD superfamily